MIAVPTRLRLAFFPGRMRMPLAAPPCRLLEATHCESTEEIIRAAIEAHPSRLTFAQSRQRGEEHTAVRRTNRALAPGFREIFPRSWQSEASPAVDNGCLHEFRAQSFFNTHDLLTLVTHSKKLGK